VDHRQPELVAKTFNKTGILICLNPTKPMIDMGQQQIDFVFFTQPMEEVAESYRIRTARDRNQYPVSWLEHSVGNKRIIDLFKQHRQFPRFG
jgi:hypothetical protein